MGTLYYKLRSIASGVRWKLLIYVPEQMTSPEKVSSKTLRALLVFLNLLDINFRVYPVAIQEHLFKFLISFTSYRDTGYEMRSAEE